MSMWKIRTYLTEQVVMHKLPYIFLKSLYDEDCYLLLRYSMLRFVVFLLVAYLTGKYLRESLLKL